MSSKGTGYPTGGRFSFVCPENDNWRSYFKHKNMQRKNCFVSIHSSLCCTLCTLLFGGVQCSRLIHLVAVSICSVSLYIVIYLLRARPKAERVILRIREILSMSGRPADRSHAFERLYISGTKSPIDKRSSLVGTPIPSTVYGTNAESCPYPLWHVARATWGDVYKCSACCFLGNGWADCAEIVYALGAPLVTAYAVVTGGVSLHVHTCRDIPTPRFCISETAWPIVFKFGMWVGGY